MTTNSRGAETLLPAVTQRRDRLVQPARQLGEVAMASRPNRRLQVLRVPVPAGHDPGVDVVGLQTLLTRQPLGEQVVQEPADP